MRKTLTTLSTTLTSLCKVETHILNSEIKAFQNKMNFLSRASVESGMEIKKYLVPTTIAFVSIGIGAGGVLSIRQFDSEWQALRADQADIQQQHQQLATQQTNLKLQEQLATEKIQESEQRIQHSQKALTQAEQRESDAIIRITELEALKNATKKLEQDLLKEQTETTQKYRKAMTLEQASKEAQQLAQQQTTKAKSMQIKYQTEHAKTLREFDRARHLKASAQALESKANQKLDQAQKLNTHAQEIIHRVDSLENDLRCAINDKRTYKNKVHHFHQHIGSLECTIQELKAALSATKQQLAHAQAAAVAVK